jgi:site-specific DNA-methyltransferase (adenine-specific)
VPLDLYYETDDVIIYCADSQEVLPLLADASIDLILTDPPYNVSARDKRIHTSIGRIKRRSGSFREVRRNFGPWDFDWDPAPFLSEALRIIRPGGSLIAHTSEFLFAAYLNSGLDHRSLLYWRKTNPCPNFRKQVVRAIEMAVWQTKGVGWTFNAGGYRPNVWDVPSVTGNAKRRFHPTQKPEPLMAAWIEVFSNPGDIVLDPFMGSGTTILAAQKAGRQAIGIEIDKEMCKVAVARLREATDAGSN